MGYLDKKYVLDVDETLYILDKFIKPSYNTVSYNVRMSETSPSIYIELSYRNKTRLIRLSNHPDPNNHLVLNYVGKRTKVSKIVSIIKNVLKRIDVQIVNENFDAISKDKGDI